MGERPKVNLWHYLCPVELCTKAKRTKHYVCEFHREQVPRELRDRVERLERVSPASPAYRPARDLHERLCLAIVAALDTPRGPRKRWAELLREERERQEVEEKAPPPAADLVTVSFKEKFRETEKAIQFVLPDGRAPWIPRSLISASEEMDDHTWLVKVPRWLAKEKGALHG